MKQYQTFSSNSRDLRESSSQTSQSSENSYVSFSENGLVNGSLKREHSSLSLSSLEHVIIRDAGYNGTLFSSVLTICSTIFGSGMLTIPYAMATIGLVNGIIAIIFFGFMSFTTLTLLGECAKSVGGRHVSFFSLSSLTYPRLSIIFDLAVGIKCFGVSISYLVIVGELLPKVILGFFPNISKDSVLLTNLFWITLCMLVVIPLSFQKSLNSLRYASTVSLIAVNYITFLVAYFFFKGMKPVKTIDDGSNPPSFLALNVTDEISSPSHNQIEYFKWSIDFFRVLPIFVFSYTCHQNLLTVFNEMKITSRHTDNRFKKTRLTTFISILIAISVYMTVGITGYLTYGNTTKSNIISMYPPSNKLVLGGQSLMALMVCISYALQCHPARKSFGNIINYIRTSKKRNGYDDGEESPLLRNNDENDESESNAKEKSPLLSKAQFHHTLTAEPLSITGESQDSLNHATTSLSNSISSFASTSNLPQTTEKPKVGINQSYNDLYNILSNNKEYNHHHSIDIAPATNANSSQDLQTQSMELSNLMHNSITSVLLTISYIIACSVKDLGVVLSVVGATGSTTICFILPGLLYYKIKKNERGDQKSTLIMKLALIISGTGVLLMINSLFFIFFKK